MKKFNLIPLLPYKSSWDFERKSKCNNILQNWKMMFQASKARGKHFLDLLNDNFHPLEPLYSKGGLWLKYFGHSNSLYARATRAIVNHAFIGKYCLCFFPKENFSCLYRNYPIKTRYHILYEYKRFNNYWNLRQDTIGHFVFFLIFNSNTFSFEKSIIW